MVKYPVTCPTKLSCNNWAKQDLKASQDYFGQNVISSPRLSRFTLNISKHTKKDMKNLYLWIIENKVCCSALFRKSGKWMKKREDKICLQVWVVIWQPSVLTTKPCKIQWLANSFFSVGFHPEEQKNACPMNRNFLELKSQSDLLEEILFLSSLRKLEN